ncbi:TPA: hypothetical protein NIB13_003509 [Pseudomonas aeruginosa]|nr:hypothetical protein [Pseudomonas aeruginosa]
MNKANECTCPSGDGSLVHPCPAHPAVEQACWDERKLSDLGNELHNLSCSIVHENEKLAEQIGGIARELWNWPQACADLAQPSPAHPAPVEQAGGDRRDALQSIMEWTAAENIPDDRKLCLIRNAARAALAQPSPKCATCGGTGMVDDGEITCSEGGIPYENGPVKCVKDCPDCKAQPSPAPAEQAEAERSALWAVHAQGPDELYAAFSREDAEKHAAELNALPMPEGIAVGAVVVPSPWPAVQHWQYLAEQEQDHKNEIAGRLRQHERIGEALRAEITQLRQHKNDYMDAGQETYWALQNEIREREAEIARLDGLVSGHTAERDAALARVAELEGKLTDWVHEGFRLNEALAVAKAQPSVPEISGIGRDAEHPRAVVLYLRNEPSDEDMRAIQNFLRAMAAPAQHSVPKAWLDVQAERRRQVEAQALRQEVAALRARADVVPDVFGLERYRVEKTGKGFWPYCVRAGDGTRELFVGHLKQCQRVATELATAFEDGKFIAAPGSSAQHSVPEVSGIGRDFAYPRSVVLYLRTEPTDDDLRAIHDGLLSLAAAPGKEGL